MAQQIKLKRSAVAGRVPSTAQLPIGELAVNTEDGKLFFQREDTTVQSFFTTNALITGSLQQSGSDSYFLSNVGIGTASPKATLDVQGNLVYLGTGGSGTDRAFFIANTVTNTFEFNNSTGDRGIRIVTNSGTIQGSVASRLYGAVGGVLLEGANGQENIALTTDGKVGIGTTSPTSKLHVSGAADVLLIEGSGSTANTSIFAIDGNNGRLFEVSDDLSDSLFSVNTIAGLPVVEVFSDNRVIMGAFNQNDFVISGSKVGIGTATPTTKLDVNGVITATGGNSTNWNTAYSWGDHSGIYLPLAGGTMTGTLKLNDNVVARFGTGNDLSIYHTGTATLFDNNVGDISFRQYADDKDIIFISDNGSGGLTSYLTLDGSTTHAYFTNPGNVGIGTATPQQALTVEGSISASGAIYDNSGTAGTAGQVIQSTGTGFEWVNANEFTGAVTASAFSGSYFDFDPLTNATAPAYQEGRVYYNSELGALTVYNDEADISLQVGQEFWVRVKNDSGAVVLNGTPVKLTGADGNNALVQPAIAEDHTTGTHYDNHILGLATHDIPINGFGYITTAGIVNDVDTSDYSAGDILYLQTGSAGTAASYLRNTPPPFPYDIVQVGFVTRVQSNNGKIEVAVQEPVHFSNISGLSGSNGEVGDLWVYQSNSSWTPTKILSGSYEVTGSIDTTEDILVNSLTVGRGSGNVSTNTALGNNALLSNTTGVANVAIGRNALRNNTTGRCNVALGVSALINNNTGQKNVALGTNALYANTTGDFNTALGVETLRKNTTGTNNTAVGISGLACNTVGTKNVAIGTSALAANTTGNCNTALGFNAASSNTVDNITAIGTYALLSNTTGACNTAVGKSALQANQVGLRNTAVGNFALRSNTTNYNTAVGAYALDANTTGGCNVALGDFALRCNTTANGNTGLGRQALQENTTGTFNTAVGLRALRLNTTGRRNTSIGYSALGANTTGTDNTAVGNNSLKNNTSGRQNTAVGVDSMLCSTESIFNVAVGYQASCAITSARRNTAIGWNSLRNTTSAGCNTALGAESLLANTAGGNTAVGALALCSNTTAGNNTGIGTCALQNNTTGQQNTALGSQALRGNTLGCRNTAIGHDALVTNTTGIRNVALGTQALCSGNGSSNVGVGYRAFRNLGVGSLNVGIGQLAGACLTTGSYNTIIGAYDASGFDGENNNIFISDGEGNVRIFATGSNGNVGIGTTSPEAKLSIAGGKIQLENNQEITWSDLGDGNAGRVSIRGSEDGDFILFRTDGGERMRLSGTNLGINTATPPERLTVQGNISASGDLYIDGTTNIDGDLTVGGIVTAQEFHTEFVSASIVYQSGSTKFGDTADDVHSFTGSVDITGSLTLDTYATNTGDYDLTIRNRYVGQNQTLRFRASPDNSVFGPNIIASKHLELASGGSRNIYLSPASNKLVTLTSTQRVGIGTTSPSYELDVAGDIRTNQYLYLGADTSLYRDGANILRTDDAFHANGNIHVGSSGYIYNRANTNSYIKFTSPDISMMGGNVGIGTTSPSNLLHVYNNTLNNGPVAVFENNRDGGADHGVLIKSKGGSDSYGLRVESLTAGQDILQLYSGSTEVVTVTHDGDVGIGTTTPSKTLTVEGDISGSGVLYLDGNIIQAPNEIKQNIFGQVRIGTYVTGYAYFSHYDHGSNSNYALRQSLNGRTDLNAPTGQNIYFNIGNSTKAILQSNGNVGIGTTSPGEILTISTPVATKAEIEVDSGADAIIALDKGASTRRAAVVYRTAGTDNWYAGTADSDVVGNGDDYFIGTTVGGTNAEFFISQSGNVGIGTDSPSEKLHILDTAPIIKIEGEGVTSAYLNFETNEVERWNIGVPSGQTRLNFNNGTNDLVTVLQSGNVGIGTTNPVQKLQVDGNIYSNGGRIYVNNGEGLYAVGELTLNSNNGSAYVEAIRISGSGAIKFNEYGSGTNTGTTTYRLAVDSSGNVIEEPLGAGAVDGAGSANAVTFWTDSDTISGSQDITWDGSTLSINGTLEASEKSFVIPHPTKEGKKLVYGVLEGPEHAVYCRGKINTNVIELPEEWTGLVDEESITVQLTSIGSHQNLYVSDIRDNKVFIKNGNVLSSKINAFYFIQGTRKDIKPLVTERDI